MQTGEVGMGHALPGVKRTYIRSQFEQKRADALLRLSQHIADVGLSADQVAPARLLNVVSLERVRRTGVCENRGADVGPSWLHHG